jgi:hypothetical protein
MKNTMVEIIKFHTEGNENIIFLGWKAGVFSLVGQGQLCINQGDGATAGVKQIAQGR